MVTIAIVIYVFMLFFSDWDFFWPITMIVCGALGDKMLALGWCVLLISGLN